MPIITVLIIKSLHIIAMVAWFAGLFYLPRLFVYHATTTDEISLQRFKIMEYRLYYAIMWPAAIVTTLCGGALLHANFSYYLHANWMQIKLMVVLSLWIYHILCGSFVKKFAQDKNTCSAVFFRLWNEVPTLMLIAIVFLVMLKP